MLHDNAKPLRIAIDAPMTADGKWGGIEQFTLALVYALGKLTDGAEEYIIGVHKQNADWLKLYLGPNQHVVVNPSTDWDERKGWLGSWRKPAGRIWRQARRALGASSVPTNGFYTSVGADVLHIPHHEYFRTRLLTIYSPHDLQHVHYPQFFRREEWQMREAIYRAGCAEAYAVAADSHCAKEDLAEQYGVDRRKVYAIPMGAPTELYDSVTAECREVISRRFQLPSTFVFYPAQTWEHKNHIRLLEAIAELRDRQGLNIHLVCTGKQNAFWKVIEKRIRELNLGGQVRFLGFISSSEVRALYQMAQFVIHPSLFEGGGLPVLEAFRERVPLTCSTAASLAEYAGGAALFFDPTSVASITEALRRMSCDTHLRARLVELGAERVRQFTWERTARAYRALYRRAAGIPLTEAESALLQDT